MWSVRVSMHRRTGKRTWTQVFKVKEDSVKTIKDKKQEKVCTHTHTSVQASEHTRAHAGPYACAYTRIHASSLAHTAGAGNQTG